eukprot:3696583-Rhodomonas_salina.1
MFVVGNCQTRYSLIDSRRHSCPKPGLDTSSQQALSRVRQALTQLACSKSGEPLHDEHLDSKLRHYTRSSTRHSPRNTRQLMLATQLSDSTFANQLETTLVPEVQTLNTCSST